MTKSNSSLSSQREIQIIQIFSLISNQIFVGGMSSSQVFQTMILNAPNVYLCFISGNLSACYILALHTGGEGGRCGGHGGLGWSFRLSMQSIALSGADWVQEVRSCPKICAGPRPAGAYRLRLQADRQCTPAPRFLFNFRINSNFI